MPAIYGHYSFGMKVLEIIDKEDNPITEIINRYKSAYIMGLQGPDFLFYYYPITNNHVSREGHNIHKRKASIFMKNAKDLLLYEYDEELVSYLFGFLCHFILDSQCHPYINSCDTSHVGLETELDVYLMLCDGYDPLAYKRANCIVKDNKLGNKISKLYPRVTSKEVNSSIKFMIKINKIFDRMSGKGMQVAKSLEGRFSKNTDFATLAIMDRKVSYDRELQVLKGLCDTAMPIAVGELYNLNDYLFNDKLISTRLNRNFV